MHPQNSQSLQRLAAYSARLNIMPQSVREGRLVRVSGLLYEVQGLPMTIGDRATINLGGEQAVEAECIGFNGATTYLMPVDPVDSISPGAPVYPLGTPYYEGAAFKVQQAAGVLPLGQSLLGRIVDGFGRPIDGKGIDTHGIPGVPTRRVNPLHRAPIHEPMDSGIRAINGALTVGRGQRVGIFAGSGVGKSVMLGMLARNCVADVMVIGLVGERGREVREFCVDVLGENAMHRSVVVAAPADASPLARVRGAYYATDVATWFRDQGKHVVLILDSLTRFAMAQREIGLSLGEAPVSRGYTPSVFAKMPELVERVGNGAREDASITAFYTILLEGDDVHDPVADTARGILDGHIFLSRELADSGHYPAIDIEKSISRVMPKVTSKEHQMAARKMKMLVSKYMRGRELLSMGAYVPGGDPEFDMAVKLWPQIQKYLQQDADDAHGMENSLSELMKIAAMVGGPK
ncbi:MAG: FliI/YscN family ATPase [Burkholderiaceae bacterium]|nr:FliI/YscN family ATPase [Burkholderiaceae bacterium]